VTAPLRLDPRQGLVRGMRAAVLTVPAVGVAALAHAMADGCGSIMAMLIAAGLCWPAAVALLGNRRKLPVLMLWLLAAQVVTHVLLEQMCSDGTSGQVGPVQHLTGGLTTSMVVAHVGAVLLTAAFLGRADAGLWTADALLRAGARALCATSALRVPALPQQRPASPPVATSVVCPRALWETAVPVRRGPPVLLAR
jgi:hypothetical protein